MTIKNPIVERIATSWEERQRKRDELAWEWRQEQRSNRRSRDLIEQAEDAKKRTEFIKPSPRGEIKAFEGLQILKLIDDGRPETLSLFDEHERPLIERELAKNRNYDIEIRALQSPYANDLELEVGANLARLLLRKKDIGIVKILKNPASVEEAAERDALLRDHADLKAQASLMQREVRAAVAAVANPTASIDVDAIAESHSVEVTIGPAPRHNGGTVKYVISLNVSADPDATYTIVFIRDRKPVDTWRVQTNAIRRVLVDSMSEVSRFTETADQVMFRLEAKLKRDIRTSLDVVMKMQPKRNSLDWYEEADVAGSVFYPGMGSRSNPRDSLGDFRVRPHINALGSRFDFLSYDQTTPKTDYVLTYHDEEGIVRALNEFCRHLEERLKDPNVRAEYDARYAAILEKERADAEAIRLKEEAKQERERAKAKTVVDSAVVEKLSILNALASKSPKPEVKALAEALRDLYSSGEKPDDDQLKRIRNYLYMTGMRPQADHFRIASARRVAARWLYVR